MAGSEVVTIVPDFIDQLTCSGILMDKLYVPQLRAGDIRGIERLICVVRIMNVLCRAGICSNWILSLSDGGMYSEPANVLQQQQAQQQKQREEQ
jgi:hypothetical protein